jgi:hypothetical protein
MVGRLGTTQPQLFGGEQVTEALLRGAMPLSLVTSFRSSQFDSCYRQAFYRISMQHRSQASITWNRTYGSPSLSPVRAQVSNAGSWSHGHACSSGYLSSGASNDRIA